MRTRLIRLTYPLAGAAASIILALLLALYFGRLGDARAIKIYAPIAIGGAFAGWTAIATKGSLEKRLFLATLIGTTAGAVSAVRFLKGEAVDTISALAIGLTLFFASVLAAATSLVLPEPPPAPLTNPARRRWFLAALGCIVVLMSVFWWRPPSAWREHWKLDIQEAAIRYWDHKNQVGKYYYTIEGRPLSQELLRRMPYLKGRKQITSEEFWEGVGNKHPQCRVGYVRWKDAVTVEMEADMSWSMGAGQGSTLVLQLTSSGWKVVIDKGGWVA